eukprot:9701004-Prorocentrum_lima.AAC.1
MSGCALRHQEPSLKRTHVRFASSRSQRSPHGDGPLVIIIFTWRALLQSPRAPDQDARSAERHIRQDDSGQLAAHAVPY